MKIVLAINYVDYQDPEKKSRQEVALSVLQKIVPKNVSVLNLCYPDQDFTLPIPTLKTLSRDSQQEIGNNRRMPYIKEILERITSNDFDVMGYMNSDVLLYKTFFDLFGPKWDAYVCYKKDIKPVTVDDFLVQKFRVVDKYPHGVDAVFFKTEWWRQKRDLFSKELIVGESEWDTVYNSIIQGCGAKYFIGRVLHHVVHDRIWSIDSRGAINNKLIWDRVKAVYGIPKFEETK
jgi:hypothetical protein